MVFLIVMALSLQAAPAGNLPPAVINVQRLIAESTIGRSATARLRALQSEKQKAIADKQANLQQLTRSAALRRQIDKAQLELQRLTEDAEAELAALDQQLRDELSRKLRPIVAKLAEEEHIGIIFEYRQQAIVWVSPSVDVTATVIERLDAESKNQK
jgi:Skp family chaperone for outer membrane proteins